jgi:multiple sugar transport system permease protein
MPTLLTAILLRALDAFRVFDLIYVLTGGGPANSTEVLSSYAYKTMFSSTQVGYGSAMATVMAFSVLLFALIMQYLLQRTFKRIEGGK